jgi:deazaflavin-dependent oxidoreductase (nitroreductase family)
VARFNALINNPIQGTYAWLLPPWTVIAHHGRRSGRPYRTPLLAFRQDHRLVVALLYGEESDWLRNLRAGGGSVIRGGRRYEIRAVRVHDTARAAQLEQLAPVVRAYCRLADKQAVLELGRRLPGFGPGRRWR